MTVGVTPREAVPTFSVSAFRGSRVAHSKPLPVVQEAVLRWFSDLDRRGAGYELRGVRGWAHTSEVATALDRILQDEITRLTARGLLDRENIALPGRSLGYWLHRISALGAEAIAATTPRPLGPPDPPSLRMTFTDPQWSALEYMRRAKTESPARFVTRELGWRTVGEITKSGSVRSRDISIWPEDVHQLERARLLEKRNDAGAARTRPLTFYRVTDLGERVTRLERHSPAPAEGA